MNINNKTVNYEAATCPICEQRNLSYMFDARNMDSIVKKQFHVMKCQGCGLVMTDPRPTEDTIGVFYENGIYEEKEKKIKIVLINPVMKLMQAQRLGMIKKFATRGKLLDVGCGKGKFLQAAAADGWEAWGIEPSLRSVQFIGKDAPFKLITGRLEEAELPEGYFDFITMWHTLEHFHRPIETLRSVYQVMSDNGYLLIRVPNSDSWDFRIGHGRWFHLDVPRHLYHFSPASLSTLLGKAGFEIVFSSTSSIEDNPIGTLQTLLAIIGLEPGSIFSVFKNQGSGILKSFNVTALSVALCTPSLLFSTFAESLGHGGTVTVIAKKCT